MKTFRCEICQKVFPESLQHIHHKIPKSLGGLDTPENLKKLCSTDHQYLHTIAYMLVNPKRRIEVEPVLASIYPAQPAIQKNLMEYAGIVAREMFLKKETRKEPSVEIRTVVELPARYMELLRLSGYDMPHQNGKNAGVSKVIRHIVAQHLIRQYPRAKEEIISLLPRKKDSKTQSDKES